MKLSGSDYTKSQRGVDGQTIPLSEAESRVASSAAANSHGFVPASSASSGSSDSLSAAAGGGIGAGVTLAVIGAILALLFATKRLTTGKRSGAAAAATTVAHPRGNVEMAQDDAHSLGSHGDARKA